MLTEFFVDGYKTLENLTVPLQPVTVIVGPNNAGKSNFIGALELFAEAVRQRSLRHAIEQRGGLKALASRGEVGQIRMLARLRTSSAEISLSLDSNGEERLEIGDPNLDAEFVRQPSATGRSQTGPHERRSGVSLSVAGGDSVIAEAARSSATGSAVARLERFFGGLFVSDLAPSELRRSSAITNTAVLGRHGENIAAVLDRLQGASPLVRRRVDEEVHRVAPSIDAVTTIPTDETGKKVVGIAEGNAVYSAQHISDGILLFIGMTTAAQMSGGQTLLALEEPDKGVHPRRIRELLDQILRVNRQGTQFVITTHSPILLSEFKDHPEAVLLFDRDGNGPTRVRRLADLPNAGEATDLSLGDLWYSGVLGGVPTP